MDRPARVALNPFSLMKGYLLDVSVLIALTSPNSEGCVTRKPQHDPG